MSDGMIEFMIVIELSFCVYYFRLWIRYPGKHLVLSVFAGWGNHLAVCQPWSVQDPDGNICWLAFRWRPQLPVRSALMKENSTATMSRYWSHSLAVRLSCMVSFSCAIFCEMAPRISESSSVSTSIVQFMTPSYCSLVEVSSSVYSESETLLSCPVLPISSDPSTSAAASCLSWSTNDPKVWE